MKKNISFSLLILTGIVFGVYSQYIKGSFDYDIAQFGSYIFYWLVTLFILSIFAISLKDEIYKKYSIISLICSIISICISYFAGSGNGSILSFDGKDITFIFAGLYTFISVIYFLIQFFKKNK